MQAGESEVWRAAPYSKGMGGVGRIIGILITTLVVWGILSIFGTVGVVIGFFIFAGGIYYLYRGRGNTGGVSFILTNKRALVLQGNAPTQSCELMNCNVSVMNKYTVSAGSGRSGGAYSGTSVEVGDVLFRDQGQNKVVFSKIQDPEGVMRTANQIISELRAGT